MPNLFLPVRRRFEPCLNFTVPVLVYMKQKRPRHMQLMCGETLSINDNEIAIVLLH